MSQPPASDPPKRGRGRPRKDPSGPGVSYSVKVSPTAAALLEARYGSVRAGLRVLVERETAKK